MPRIKATASQTSPRKKQPTKTATSHPTRRTRPTPRLAVARNVEQSAPETKSSIILSLLSRKKGATLAEIMSATHWQAHSVRGFLSGTVKKKLGLSLTSVHGSDGIRRYTIEAIDK